MTDRDSRADNRADSRADSRARDGHEPENPAADPPHLTRRRLLVTGLGMGAAALSLWARHGRTPTVPGTQRLALPAWPGSGSLSLPAPPLPSRAKPSTS